MLIPSATYPGQTVTTDAGYPYGKARNVTVAGDGTGTPWEERLINDLLGAHQSVAFEAGITPSGTPDKVGASDFLSALRAMANARAERFAIANHLARAGTASGDYNAVAYTGTHVVAATHVGGGDISSNGGATWSSWATGTGGAPIHDLQWNGTVGVLAHSNGISTFDASGTVTARVTGVAFTRARWVAALALWIAVSDTGQLRTAPADGVTWTVRSPAAGHTAFYGVSSVGSRALVSSNAGVMYSTNGSAWTGVTIALGGGTPRGLASNGRTAIMSVSPGGSPRIYTTEDGSTWTLQPATIPEAWTLLWTGNQFLHLGTGTLSTSPDGRAWKRQRASISQLLNAAVVADDSIIMVGADGTIRQSLWLG